MGVLLRLFVFGMMLFLVGCSGGGAEQPTDTVTYTVQKLDVQHKKKTVFDKNNSVELLKMIAKHSPTGIGLEKNDVREAIATNESQTQTCAGGGSLKLTANSTKNQLTILYDQCIANSSLKLDGEMIVTLDKSINGSIADYLTVKNMVYSYGGYMVTYNYTVKAYIQDGVNRWDYYVEVKDTLLQQEFKYNFYISQDDEEMKFSGTYLLQDDTYFTLSSAGLPSYIGMYLFGFAEEINFDSLVLDGGKVLLEGDESSIKIASSSDISFVELTEKGNTFYAESGDDEWTSNPYDLFPNGNEPSIDLIINGDIIWDEAIFTHDKKISLKLEITDDDNFHDYHTVKLKLVSKPTGSELSTEEQTITMKDGEYASITYSNVDIAFDKDGSYTFVLTVVDGEYTSQKEFTIEYYDAALSENQHLLSGNILDSVFLSNKNAVALLSSKPTNKLTLMGTNGSVLSTLDLPAVPSALEVSQDQKKLAISADAKIFLVDVTAVDNPQILETYDVPAKLGEISMHKNYIYALEKKEGHINLYSVNIADGNYTTIESASHGLNPTMIVNPVQESLYIMDSGLSPQNIDKFDISSGEAQKLYGSPDDEDQPFCSNMWLFSNGETVTACGVTLTMDSAESDDMQYHGMFPSENLSIDEYGNPETIIRSMHTNKELDKTLVSISTKVYNYDTDTILDDYRSMIEIYSHADKTLKYSSAVQKYYVDDDGKEYLLFIEDAYLVSSNKVLIVYRAVINHEFTHNPDNDKFIFEIKDI